MRSPKDNRSPHHRSSRKRSPTVYHKDRKRSASPSPPRPTAKTLKAIRITVSNVPGKSPAGTNVSSFDYCGLSQEVTLGFQKTRANT